MTSLLSAQVSVTYGLLTASVVSLWVTPLTQRRLRPSIWNVLLLLSLGSGIGAGLLQPVALVSLALLGVSVYCGQLETLPIRYRLFSALVTLILSLVMMLHMAPGFIPLKVLDGVRISPDAIPYSKSLNFDKPLVGLLILVFGHRLLSTPGQWRRMFRTASAAVPVVIVSLLALSYVLGYVRFDAKWPSFGWFWLWTNLIFTCIPEEALFRGFIQWHLERLFRAYAKGPRIALGLSGLLFGVAHFAGGVKYIILAAVAGWGYGYIYQRTRCIEASILMHFLLNVLHFVLFTYPALQSAVV